MTRPQRPKLTPQEAELVRVMQLSRRSMLGGVGALGVGAFLAACGTSGSSSTGGGTGGSATPSGAAKPTPAVDRSDTEKIVNWANWTLYLDYDDKTKTYPTLEEFQKQTGIKATYSEDIEDNDSYYGKIQGQLKNGQDIGKDIIVLTDWMASRVIGQGYTQKLDKANIPNGKNILDNLANVDYDKGRNYSMTWQSGYTGVAWNNNKVPAGIHTISDLWKPELKGRVEVLSEMRDTIGLIMLDQGNDPSKPFGADKYDAAVAELEKQLNNGQIRQVKGNSYKEDLISEDALAVIAWSGDITQLNFENAKPDKPKWTFAIPDPGGMLWSDNLMVPIGSPHKKNAEILMNYYYDPVVAAKVAAYVNYICPVKGAKEAMQAIDPTLVGNTSIFPSAADLSKVYAFRTLEPAEETDFNTKFQKVLGV